MNITTKDENATMELGNKLAEYLSSGDIVLLTGDLGAGKTTFTKGLAQGLGVVEAVTSPSFTLMNQYHGSDGQYLYHFDLYRIADPDEFLELGIEEFMYGEGVSVVEWCEKLPEMPEHYLLVDLKMSVDDLESRAVQLTAYGEHYEKLLLQFKQEVSENESFGN